MSLTPSARSRPHPHLASAVEHLHRLHPYCARFPSEIAETAIDQFTVSGDSVFDPFCGSGTTLVAGLVRNRKVVGADVDVLAGLLSEIKCTPRAPDRYKEWRRRFGQRITDIFNQIDDHWPPTTKPQPGRVWVAGDLTLRFPSFLHLNYWFPPKLIAYLAGVSEAAHACRDKHFESVALASLSAAVIAKWPNTLSYAMDIDHTRPHRRLQAFTRDRVLSAYLGRLDRTVECLGALYELYESAGVHEALATNSRVVCPHDSRRPVPDIVEASQALIVTSPPYFDAVDYPRGHRYSTCWMNGRAPSDLSSRKGYIGLRPVANFSPDEWLEEHTEVRRLVPVELRATRAGRRLVTFFADLESVIERWWGALRPGGHAVVVIADNAVRGHRISSHEALLRLARHRGLVEVARGRRRIASVKRRFPVGTFGFDGPMTHEHVFVLRKPKPRTGRRSGRN